MPSEMISNCGLNVLYDVNMTCLHDNIRPGKKSSFIFFIALTLFLLYFCIFSKLYNFI